MTPAPLVTINGAKTLTATYGDAVTKLEDINHQKTEGTLKISESDKGIIEVYTGTEPTKESCKNKLNSGAKVVVGQYLGVVVKPAGKNTIRNVSNNDVTVVDPKANEMYFFEVQEGENKIGANYIGNDTNPAVEMATVKVTAPEGVKVVATSFVLDGMSAGDFQPLPENGKVMVGRWMGIDVKGPEGKTVESVTYNGTAAQIIMNQYCFQLKEAIKYDVIVKLSGEVAPEPEATEATITINAATGITFEARTFKINGQALEDSKELPADGKVEKGRWLGIKITAPTDKEFDVKVGDTALSLMFGEYCLNINEAKAYDITITIKGAPVETKATIKIAAAEGITYEARTFKINGQALEDSKALPEDGKVEKGRWLGIKITAPTDKEFDVKVGDKALSLMFGEYCLNIAEAKAYNITIAVKDASVATHATFKVVAPEGVTYKAIYFTMAGMQSGQFTPVGADNKVPLNNFLGLTLTLPEGKGVKTAKCDGNDVMFVAGQYCVNITEAKQYVITIEIMDVKTYTITGLTEDELKAPLYVWGWAEKVTNSSAWYKVNIDKKANIVSVTLPAELDRAIVVVMNAGTTNPDWSEKAKQTNNLTLVDGEAIVVEGQWK